MTTRNNRGFTLIEVLVALIIVGFMLPALLLAYSSQADGLGYLRDKSFAHWVAANKMTEARIEIEANQQLFVGERSGSKELAGREWFWWLTSEATTVDNLVRVTVEVGLDEDGEHSLYTIMGFLAIKSQQVVVPGVRS